MFHKMPKVCLVYGRAPDLRAVEVWKASEFLQGVSGQPRLLCVYQGHVDVGLPGLDSQLHQHSICVNVKSFT